MVFSLLFTPIGRYLAMAVAVVIALGGVYFKIRADAIAEVEAAAMSDAMRRMENAVNAGDNVDVSAAGVRKPDGNRRDE
jgi:hypothetical protein